MAEGLEAFRRAGARNAARRVGLRLDQPNLTVGDQELLGNGSQAEIFALPVDTSEQMAMQDLDPSSATFTFLRFIVDLDIPGNPKRWIP